MPVEPTPTPSNSRLTAESFSAPSTNEVAASAGPAVGIQPLENARRPAGATAAEAFLIIAPLPERATVCALPAALLLMVSVPLWLPPLVGLNVTVTVQLEPAARDAHDPEVLAPNGAEVEALTTTVILPAGFVTVSVWVPVEPVGTRPKLRLVLDSVSGAAAAPVKLSAWVPALSVIVTVPVRVPAALGVKVIVIVQLAPAATVPPTPGHEPKPANAKSPVIVYAPEMVRAELPVLVSVAVFTTLVVPTVCAAKLSGLGERLTEPVLEEAPVPLRLTVPVVAVEARIAVRVPVAVGANVTLIVQLPPAARDVPQVLV